MIVVQGKDGIDARKTINRDKAHRDVPANDMHGIQIYLLRDDISAIPRDEPEWMPNP